MKRIRSSAFAGLAGLGVLALLAAPAALAQGASPSAPAVPVTMPAQQHSHGAATAAPAKEQATVAPNAAAKSSAAAKSDGAKAKKPPAGSAGRMLNPYSEMPETKYIRIPVSAKGCAAVRSPDKPYFVEFRARNAASFGHTFVLYGKLGAGNRFASYKVAGLHPKGGPTQYTIGLWVPVPAETGPSDGDIDEQFLEARYCVALTEAEYRKTAAYIRSLQAKHSTWHGTSYNCNSFGMDIAKFVGLDTPNPNMHLPKELIEELAAMNKNRPRGELGKTSSLF